MIGSLVAVQVIGVEITSSPGPTPLSRSARWIAEVQEFTVTTFPHPTHGARACSNSSTRGPCPTYPLRSVRRSGSRTVSGIWTLKRGITVVLLLQYRHQDVVDVLSIAE